MLKKLAEIANALDAAGQIDLADSIDAVINDLEKQAADANYRSPQWIAAADKAVPQLWLNWGELNKLSPGGKEEMALGNAIKAISDLQKSIKLKLAPAGRLPTK